MRWIYTLGVRLYGLGIRVASLFNPKAKEWISGRKNWKNKLPNTEDKEVIWFHCASLGEFDQGLPLMELIKKKNNNCFLLVTFFSPSGFKHYQKREHSADFVCYLPLDTPSNAKHFVNYFNPTKVFFVKYEFWANTIFAIKKTEAKLYAISALFRKEHRFFKPTGGFFRKVLRQFDIIFVQNKSSQQLLNSIQVESIVTGDTRFDKVKKNAEKTQKNTIIEQFKNNNDIFIVGSSWPEDEVILFEWINNSNQKILIAPHEIGEKHISEIEKGISRKYIRYSDAEKDNVAEYDILILNTIGHLASAYSYGKIAYVGGGFSGNLHNILEPAVFGLPVLFGPKHTRFPEAQQFIDGGFGFSVSTTEQLRKKIDLIESNHSEISEKEKDFVEKNVGASKRIYSIVIE